ncbi:hypothetical protein BDC45DRAFT_531540 [Circinella umbellata]|nr:hypothetical protein BDC45DRAFT_531540 [Circinella umbellata]
MTTLIIKYAYSRLLFDIDEVADQNENRIQSKANHFITRKNEKFEVTQPSCEVQSLEYQFFEKYNKIGVEGYDDKTRTYVLQACFSVLAFALIEEILKNRCGRNN